jgi:hypothetical protein
VILKKKLNSKLENVYYFLKIIVEGGGRESSDK